MASHPNPLFHDLAIGPDLVRLIQICHGARIPLLLEGGTGIGKSAVVIQTAQLLGIGYSVLDLSVLDTGDLVGMPFQKDGVTYHAPPARFPREGYGVLMIEELNRAPHFMQQPALQLLTARRLHDYVLPEGWSVIAAMNPEDGEYQVNALDPALRRRFVQLRVCAERSTWLGWARAAELHPAILGVVKDHEEALAEVPPRSWTYAALLLAHMTPEQLADPRTVRALLAGCIEPAWTELVMAQPTLRRDAVGEVDVRALLSTYHRDAELRHNVQRLIEEGRTDLLERIARRVQDLVSGPGLAEMIDAREIELAAFERLLEDLPGDRREDLEEGLGKNPLAEPLLPLNIQLSLPHYKRSAARRHVKAWADTQGLAYRVHMLISALAAYVEQNDPAEIREDSRRLRGLGLLIEDLGVDRTRPLLKALNRKHITLHA